MPRETGAFTIGYLQADEIVKADHWDWQSLLLIRLRSSLDGMVAGCRDWKKRAKKECGVT